ncbi:hypothetical protein [Lentzea guizhouensis]|uniref:hypothetical protein n=1 Tax=Lentzea guizhouensis TaxID=1586287 RepID=UPI0012B6831C|nr:hypothetical protein [Lentzea guizhouensis]
MTVPVPARLEGRPRQGGLVVPWVSVQLGDGTFDFGNMHNTRASLCFVESRCQIDGQQIAPQPLVFFVSERSLEDLTTTEPPVHPECAAYSRRACPMVAGQMKRYRRTPSRAHGPAGEVCFDPGCECGGWVRTPGQGETNAGQPAQRWYMVWCRNFAITVPDEETRRHLATGAIPTGVSIGAKILDPLKIRPVA